MLGTLGFEKYRIRCIIGNDPHEREAEQDIFVDVTVAVDIAVAAKSDAIEDAVDYVHLAVLCKEMAIAGRYRLLEKYAVDTAQAIKKQFGATSVKIVVRKPKAIDGAECAFVSVVI